MKYSFTGVSLHDHDQIEFLRRLIPRLSPHNLVDLCDCDVVISVGKPLRDHEKPLIVKWDATCDNQTEADAYVVQTEGCVFDDRCIVINDGIDTSNIQKESPTGFQLIGQVSDLVFVSSSPRWSHLDRLDDVMKTYQSLKESYGNQGKRTSLILMGDGLPGVRSGVDIFTVPWLEETQRLQLYSSANWTISFSERTQLPVEVLESLSQGTPIMHNDQPVVKKVCGDRGFLWSSTHKNVPDYPWNLEGIDIQGVAEKYSRLIESLVRR